MNIQEYIPHIDIEMKASHQIVLATILSVKAILLSIYYHLRKRSKHFGKKVNAERLGTILHDFSHLCDLHYKHAEQMLRQYILKKGNKFDIKMITYSGTEKMETINPSVFFKEYMSFFSEKDNTRIIFILTNVLNKLEFHNEEMQEFCEFFTTQYEKILQEYYDNMAELGRLHAELRDYIKDKSLNKGMVDWLHSFFAIFDQWQANGESEDMAILEKDVVQKILLLNRQDANNPFSCRTNEKALKCTFAFQQIAALDDSCRQKLTQYIAAYRRACRITTIIAKNIIPDPTNTLMHTEMVKKYNVRERVLICTGFLLIAVISFFGGLLFYKSSIEQQAANGSAVRKIDSALRQLTTDTFPSFEKVREVSGIDISRYQGKLLEDITNLDTLHFVICKASEGKSLVDAGFNIYWKKLKAMHVIRGAYHFYRAREDPIIQAEHFLKTVGTFSPTDIPPILDIEELGIEGMINPESLQPSLLSFLNYVKQQTGRIPVIYADLYFADKYLHDKAFADYPLWLAEYSHKAFPTIPTTWKEKGNTFWQKNDSYSINSQKIDFDTFNGDGIKFIEFIKSH
jgi:lysozyme